MRYANTTGPKSPVDDLTYDLLQSLTTKLESVETFSKYSADGGETADLFDRLAADDAAHATQLLEALRQRLNS